MFSISTPPTPDRTVIAYAIVWEPDDFSELHAFDIGIGNNRDEFFFEQDEPPIFSVHHSPS
jgi:hypothetical protein